MRIVLLSICCLFLLVGCVSYVGIHGSSKPLTPATLSERNYYNISFKSTTLGWWEQFNDSQLNQLVEVALQDSPNMQAAKNRVTKAQALVAFAASSLWPSITLDGQVIRERFANQGLIPPPFNGRTFNIEELGLNFNYEFDFWGKNRQAVVAQVSELCALQADLAQARLIISAAVVSIYFDLQDRMKQLTIAQDILKQRQELFAIVNYRTRRGIESDIPLKTSLGDTETARVQVGQYQQSVLLAQHQLAVLLGKNPFTTELLIKKITPRNTEITLSEQLPANLLAQRPDIIASRFRVEAAAHQINVAKARFFPNINLYAFFTYEKINFGHLFEPGNQNNALSAAIDLPIFDAGARRANLKATYEDYDLAVDAYNQTILNALQEVADQASILHSLQDQLKAEVALLKATQNTYKLVKSRYNHGIVDYVQVLEIQGTLLQQRAEQLNLLTRQTQAKVTILRALGGKAQA